MESGNERAVRWSLLTYPIAVAAQNELVGLWRTEWTGGDYDWLKAMYGDYRRTLSITTVLGRIDDRPVSTATVLFRAHNPAVCLLSHVLTHPEHRGLGLGGAAVEAAVRYGFDAGCRIAYLGSGQMQNNLYERCGFERLAGCLMRRPAPGNEIYEEDVSAPGQSTSIRRAQWGDMPGMVCFLTRPMQTRIIDYPRCLISIRYAAPLRCVSAFPTVHHQIMARGGEMLVLSTRDGGRILGLATLTPGPAPGRQHKALIDLAVLDPYHHRLDLLLEHLKTEARERHVESLQACVCTTDTAKAHALSRAGLRPVASLPGQFRLNDGIEDGLLVEGPVEARDAG